MGTDRFTIRPLGPFSLQEAAEFGFGQRFDTAFDGVMRMAFCLDGEGYCRQIGVELRQDGAGVHGVARGDFTDLETVEHHVARVLSLDHDARPYVAVGERDTVVATLQAAAPGLRPPLFYSPYEAALWAVLSARRPQRQMAAVRAKMSAAHGRSFDLAEQSVECLPTPDQMLGIPSFPGLPDEKIERMHGIAAAAKEGLLDTKRLQDLGPEAALQDLQKLRGIGPFYASLIVVRACGFADVLVTDEPRLRDLVAKLYSLEHPPSHEEFARLGDVWRPMRTWVAVLIRSAGPRVLEGTGSTKRASTPRATARKLPKLPKSS